VRTFFDEVCCATLSIFAQRSQKLIQAARSLGKGAFGFAGARRQAN
jgi:hypothetical protein